MPPLPVLIQPQTEVVSIFSCQFSRSTVGSVLCLKFNCMFRYCITHPLCLSAFKTLCFSFPAPFTYLRCWQNGTKHILYLAQRATKSPAQQPTGNLSKVLSFAEAAEVSRNWIENGPMGSEHWRGVARRGSEVACIRVGVVGGISAAGPDVSTLRGSKNG